LELSNGSYVNIQFGRNGFSLEEFDETDIKGENVLNSILNTWGQDGAPFSFCELGNANYNYGNLIEILKEKKNEEQISFQKNGKVNYNLLFRNCHNFVCYIETILFGKYKKWHSFEYYLDGFYNHFFPEVDFDNLKSKYKEKLIRENAEIYKSNMEEVINICRESDEISESFYEFQDNITNNVIEVSNIYNN